MLQFTTVLMPAALPKAKSILEACARGMARASVRDSLVTFDYTARGLQSEKWLPVVSRLRGLVVDAADPTDPVRVWPTPMVTDLQPDTLIPAGRTPYVQEKLDGVLVARFESRGAWRWASREGINPELEEMASQWWSRTSVRDDVVASNLVLYFELCDPGLPTPTHSSAPGLYLLDIMDRKNGTAFTVPDMAALAERVGLRTPSMREWPGSLAPFVAELQQAGPEVEGYIFRWGQDIRGRLVNDKYTQLWNLVSTKSIGAIVDLWLQHQDDRSFLDWIPADLHEMVSKVCDDLGRCTAELLDLGVEQSREAAAYLLIAAAGGPERS